MDGVYMSWCELYLSQRAQVSQISIRIEQSAQYV